MSFKQKVYKVIQPGTGNPAASRIFDRLITGLIFISVIIVFALTFELPNSVLRIFRVLETFASLTFTVEYLLRIWTADCLYPKEHGLKARWLYVVSPLAIIDLLAILPFWLPMFLPSSMLGMRGLRLVRILRILKLNRYSDALSRIGSVVREKKSELVGSLFFVFVLMLVASLLIHGAEHDAQPEVFKNAFSGFWWAMATLTTVGYGDIYPVTTCGRVLGIIIALLGISAVAIPTGIISSGLMSRMEAGKHSNGKKGSETARPEVKFCPYCGKRLPE